MKLRTKIEGRGSLAIVTGLLLLAMHGSVGAAPSPLPFLNRSSVTASNSLWQNITNAGYPTSYACTQSNDFRQFRGAFTASSTSTKLAIHADDDAKVKINGTTVLNFHGQNEHLQNPSALRLIPATLATGVEYCIEIDFTNHLHEANDLDGVTLYAYDGGGSVRDGIAVWGPNFVCPGDSIALDTCGAPSFVWVSSAPSVATVSGTGSSVTVQGIANGTATITAYDSLGKSGSRTVTVIVLGISPLSTVTCPGVTNTFVVTNAQVTGGVSWTPAGIPSADTRSNRFAFTAAYTEITATWNSCSAVAYIYVVNTASLTASTNRLCGAGQIVYAAATEPPGFEHMLTWSGEGLTGSGASRTNAYSTPGVKTVTVSCGTSVQSNVVTVHKVDITNALEYALVGGSAAPFRLSSDSVGPFTWTVTPSGPTVNGSGTNVTVSPGSTPGAYTVKAAATDLSSCNDTSTLQVVQVTFSASSIAFCEGATSNVTFTVNPTNALSLLSFDTVTDTATGGTNTHSHVTVSGTNLTVHGDVAGTAYLRAKIGNTVLVGPTLQIVRVTFPTNDWYVGVGRSITNTVTIIPANASVTFDTASSAIATAQAVSGGVKLTGVAPGMTQVRAMVGGSMVCSTKNVTAVRVKFATNALTVCNGNPASVDAAVDPPGSPVTFVLSSSNLLQVTVVGTNVTVTPNTNGSMRRSRARRLTTFWYGALRFGSRPTLGMWHPAAISPTPCLLTRPNSLIWSVS